MAFSIFAYVNRDGMPHSKYVCLLCRSREMEEYIETEFDDEFDDGLTEEDILLIQEEYRRKRLIESLIGPVVSTLFHIALIIVLAIFITDTVKEPVAEIEVVMETIEEVEIEPPPIEQPEPEEVEPEDTTNPVLTTVAVENVDTNDAALEDTNDDAPSTDDNMMDQAVSDVVVSTSAYASPTVYGGRSAAGRASAVSNFGGSKVGQDALLKALWWLAKVQNPDGSWGTKHKGGLTGLALLTFLAHGETQTSKHFGKTVKTAIQWLMKDPMTKKGKHESYDHAIKTYALSEAFAMTGVSMIEAKMNEGIRIIVDNQHEGGAFDYGYSKNQSRQDVSLSGWNFQALKAAYGAGCEEKGLQEAIYKAIEWLKGCSDADVSFNYVVKDNDFDGAKKERQPSMRAVGALCLQLFGEGHYKGLQDEIKKIATDDIQKIDWQQAPEFSLYGWYYATQTMFQHGGTYWKSWNRKFQKTLTENQSKEGYWDYPNLHRGVAGHFSNVTGERIYATTLCGLMLTVYYRYLPSNKSVSVAQKDMKAKPVEKEKMMEEEGIDLVE